MQSYSRKPIFKNVFLAVGVIFLLVGSVFLGVGGAMYAHEQYFKQNGVPTEAIIEDISNEDVYIRYETEAGAFSGPLGFYSSSMREGDTVPIYYDPQNPGRMYATSIGTLNAVFITVSILLLVLGSGLVLHSIMKGKRERWLLEHGTRIQAKVTGIEVDRTVSSNRHPFRLICQHKMPDGTIWEFLSGHIWYDPEDLLTSDMVDVYLDPKNMERYYVDLSTVLPDEDVEI